MSDFNAEVAKLYQTANGKSANLGTLDGVVDYSAKNQASLQPGGADPETDETEDKDEEDLNKQEQVEIDVSDALTALFEGSNASPEFVTNFKTIFEASLNEKSAIIEEAVLEASKEIISEQIEAITETLTGQLNEYLTYVVEEWMTENKLAIEGGFKTEIAENFIMGLKELFENSFIDVPQEKYDVLDEVFAANEELEQKANEILAENIDLKNKVVAHQCMEEFFRVSSGLADTQIEKLATLSENISFDTLEQYAEKIQILKDSYFNGKSSSTSQLLTSDEETTNPNRKPIGSDPIMEAYISTISRQLKLTNNSQRQK